MFVSLHLSKISTKTYEERQKHANTEHEAQFL